MKQPWTDYLVHIDYRSKWGQDTSILIPVRAFTEQQAIERAMSKFITKHGVGRNLHRNGSRT